MGTGETGTPTKAAKISSAAAQDQQPAPTTYPEWAAAFQAYYSSGGQAPHGYFPPTVASGHQPHPFMWGAQPMMPPYGAPPPPPYGAMYPHGGMYSHPSNSLAPGAHPFAQYGVVPSPGAASEALMGVEAESEGKKVSESIKGSKRSKNKGGDHGKANPASANGVSSQSSGESGSTSEGSSEASDEDTQNNNAQKRSYDLMIVDAAGGGGGTGVPPAFTPQSGGGLVSPSPSSGGNVSGLQSGTGTPSEASAGGAAKLTASMSGGMPDYWNGVYKGGKRASASTSSGLNMLTTSSTPMVGRDGGAPELWLQDKDEREVKRQRRKQSNRESARRSRLRKQAECEELATRVDTLSVENMALRTELTRLSEECHKLTAENASLLEQVQKSRGSRGAFQGDGADVNQNQEGVETAGHIKVLDVNKTSSPQRHDDDVSCDLTSKASPSLNSGSCAESVAG